MKLLLSVTTLLLSISCATCFAPIASSRTVPVSPHAATIVDAPSVSQDVLRQLNEAGVKEQACLDAAAKIERQGPVSYIHWAAKGKSTPPLILVHGFDSSCLEFRRLGPRLAALGVDTYAVDVLGWGFTDLQGVDEFSAENKIKALQEFVATKFGPDAEFAVAGASLGGAAAIELAYASQDNCAALVLMDAQGFTDGVGPMASLPGPLAQMGVAVLKSVPLRNSANQMSYFDKETFATEEAQVIGRVHCLRDGWSDAMVSFMKSGGFQPSSKVPQLNQPALVLWGRQDTILDGKEFATKFVETLPDPTLKWIEDCGHVPHLEKPEETAEAIAGFLAEKVGGSKVGRGDSASSPPPYAVGSVFFATLALLLGKNILEKLQ